MKKSLTILAVLGLLLVPIGALGQSASPAQTPPAGQTAAQKKRQQAREDLRVKNQAAKKAAATAETVKPKQ